MRCLGLAICLMGCLGSGCQLPKPRKPYPPDPMFESKQPLDRPTKMPAAPSPVAAAVAAPRPPQCPDSFLVAPFLSPSPTREEPCRSNFGTHRDAAPPPGQSNLACEQAIAEESTAPPAIRGQAEDFRWLVGVLEKQLDGRLLLRFGDAGAPFAGKVCLQPVTLLARFADGDLMRVEGVLVPRLTAPPTDWWDDPPRYWVIAVSRGP